MAIVHIPSLLQDMTGGQETVKAPGTNLRQLIEALEARFPGLQDRLCREGRLRPNVAAWVDGEPASAGLLEPLKEESEVHFLPAISGGRS